jgi:hypothetical protein
MRNFSLENREVRAGKCKKLLQNGGMAIIVRSSPWTGSTV